MLIYDMIMNLYDLSNEIGMCAYKEEQFVVDKPGLSISSLVKVKAFVCTKVSLGSYHFLKLLIDNALVLP